MELIEVHEVPEPGADRAVTVPRPPQGRSRPLAPGERVVLVDAEGEYFSGTVQRGAGAEGPGDDRIEVGGRLPPDLALRRVGKIVDLTAAARREAASLQELADLLALARQAERAAPVVPAQRGPREAG